MKQVFVSLFESDGLAKLLELPGGGWMGGDVAMDQAPAAAITTNTYINRNVAVTVTRKSQAMIPWA